MGQSAGARARARVCVCMLLLMRWADLQACVCACACVCARACELLAMYFTYWRDLQLLRADSLRQLKSFGDDLIDSELYMVLIRTHAPTHSCVIRRW